MIKMFEENEIDFVAVSTESGLHSEQFIKLKNIVET